MTTKELSPKPVGDPGDTPYERGLLSKCAFCDRPYVLTCDEPGCGKRICEQHAQHHTETASDRCPEHRLTRPPTGI